MPNIPLAYESLKAVLQYLDATTRIGLLQNCPSLRTADRRTPLKIEYLFIGDPFTVKVNSHEYKLGLYRKYPEGQEVPILHQELNDKGGIRTDLDDYGVPSGVSKRDEYQKRRAKLQWVKWYEKCLEYKLNPSKEIKLTSDMRIYLLRHTVEQIRIDIEKSHTEVKPYLDKQNNVRPSYELMIQVTTTARGEDQIQRVNYRCKLNEAMNNLLKFMLNNRSTIFVKHLNLSSKLPIPTGPKFKIRHLELDRQLSNDLDNLNLIIDPASFPLEVLDTLKQIGIPGPLNHPVETAARKLILHACIHGQLSQATVLGNHEIHVKWGHEETDGYVNVFRRLIKYWIEKGREVGSCFRFDLDSTNFTRLMGRISDECVSHGGRRTSELSFIIPFSYDNDIHVVFEPDTSRLAEDRMEEGYPYWTRGMLIITVVAL